MQKIIGHALLACFLVFGSLQVASAHGDDETRESVMQASQEHEAAHPAESVVAPPVEGMSMEIIPNWHPIFVHFSIGLLLTATGLFVAAALGPRTSPWRATCLTVARWNLWLGAVITLGTLLAGWYAFNSVNHDDQSHLAMLSHRQWALTTAAVFVALAVGSFIGRKREPHALFVIGIVAASGLLLVTGYKGGELVYRHGLGVMALPEADSHHHQH